MVTLWIQLEVFTDTVEYHHLVVDRITDGCQDSTDECLVDFKRETNPAVTDGIECYDKECIDCQGND